MSAICLSASAIPILGCLLRGDSASLPDVIAEGACLLRLPKHRRSESVVGRSNTLAVTQLATSEILRIGCDEGVDAPVAVNPAPPRAMLPRLDDREVEHLAYGLRPVAV